MILDGSGVSRAVIETTAVEIIPFYEVSAGHASAVGEDDHTLSPWRRIHREFYERFVAAHTPFRAEMPIVCQLFRVAYPTTASDD